MTKQQKANRDFHLRLCLVQAHINSGRAVPERETLKKLLDIAFSQPPNNKFYQLVAYANEKAGLYVG